MPPSAQPAGRLASLDILRGFDLFMLVFFQPVFMAFAGCSDAAWTAPIVRQFTHVQWEGFHAWDLVMPLFLFMAGVSMPFALNKYTEKGEDRKPLYRRIIRRVVLLWVLGGIVQGNFLGFDPDRIYLYSNTLQAIAAGYLIAAVVQLNLNDRGLLWATAALFVAYWLPMTLNGDWTPDGNLAEAIDRAVLGRFRDGASPNGDGTWTPAPWYHYTWIWSSLNFGVTVLLGVMAGKIMRRFNAERRRAVIGLATGGAALTVAGLLLSLQMPIIKTIWSSSMTLFSGGLCFLLMALFYYIIDYRGCARGLGWLRIYGMNSIAAYVLGEAINFRSIARSLCYGMEPWFGDCYGAWLTFVNFLIVFFILRCMYRCGVFLKV